MAKLQRKCDQCGKVKTVKYTGVGGIDIYFCSDECALKYFSGVSITKCANCEKTLSEGKGFCIKSYHYVTAGKIYCSAECFLADRNIVPIEEVNQDKENHHGYICEP